MLVVIVFAFVLFLSSFIVFALQVSELWYLPIFGLKGFELLLSNFPWILVVIVMLFIGLLEFLVDRYGFVYRKPVLYSALLIIFIVIGLSFIVRQTNLHEKIYGEIKGGSLQPMKYFYDNYTKPSPAEFHPGTVLSIGKDGFTLENRDKTTIYVKVSGNTKIGEKFKVYPGGRLLIIGKIIDGQIEADAIDNAPPEGRP